MASIDWPQSLPQKVLSQSFRESQQDASIRFTVDSGPAKKRIRTATLPSEASFEMYIDANQFTTLRNFFKTTTRSGTLKFNFTHPITETQTDARFLEPPQVSTFGQSHIVFLARLRVEFFHV